MVTAAGKQSMKSDAAATVKCPKCGNPVQFNYRAALNKNEWAEVTVELPGQCPVCGTPFNRVAKECDRQARRREYMREWQRKNPDYQQTYRAENREKVREHSRKYRAENLEKIKQVKANQ